MTDKSPSPFPSSPVRVVSTQGAGVGTPVTLGPLVTDPEMLSVNTPPGTLGPRAVTVPLKLHVPGIAPVLRVQLPPPKAVTLVMSRTILPVGPNKLSLQTLCP